MKLGKIFGVGIYVNPFFLALIALFFVAGVLDRGLVAFLVVLIHEFAHSAAAKRMGVQVTEVELLPFGGVTRMGSEPALDPLKELYIAAAGPFSNMLMVLAAIACKNYGIWDDNIGPFFLQSNILIAAFNILPALPLDGGRVYRAFLAGSMGLKKATYRAASFGQAWAVLIVAVGLAGLLLGFTGLDVMITGMFLYYAATREKLAAPYLFMKHVIRKKDELNEDGILPAETLVALEHVSLGDITRLFVPRRFHLVIVLDSQLKFKGVATEDIIVERLMAEGLDLPIGKVIDD
ncbi:stage IV sporulation pro-sigma-K processing enzyme SpoIVFB [Desulfocucumis palustris]|uniref:Stage IV sporulation pro-sigma-K processing enzyme SpoIVFB n=1 Tax=Desulfocucumis palustris TaxID=1898651 RepID=A0A2L2XFH2_9FIRM|nr:M50 family metallopeptidase [Desulfocucumis palustris]GBF34882.1 stage IV sporulation pro-sigma-K processing enzyme SpoIVFB [Desulfocucumis palustris]